MTKLSSVSDEGRPNPDWTAAPPRRFQQLLLRAIVIPPVVMTVLAGVLVWQVMHLVAVSRTVERSDAVVDQTDHIAKLLVDMETGLRGYIITHQAKYLEPYTQGQAQVDREFADLSGKLSSNPEQLDRLKSVQIGYEAWRADAQNWLDQINRGTGGTSNLDRSKEMMDGLRLSLGQMALTATNERHVRSDAARRTATTALIVAIVLAALSGLGLAVFSRRLLLAAVRTYSNALDESQAQAAAVQRGNKAQSWLAAIVESSDDAIIGISLDGVITSWNQAATRLFGYTDAEAIGRSVTMLLPPDRQEEEKQILRRICDGDRIQHFETRRVAKDGKTIDVSLTISPVRDSQGRLLGASKFVRDISDRKRAEAERDRLLASERTARSRAEYANRMKDEFLATVSHELRTPLTAILGWAQLLGRQKPDAENLRHGLDTIEKSARSQTQLIEELLDMNRIITGKLRLEIQRVDPATVIEAAIETVKPAIDAKGLRLQKFLDPHAGPISGDPNRLQQVMWNLLSNAVKFTPRGGRIQVFLERINSHLEIRISDTGQGIAAEFLPHVFDRFRQADASTTRQHGGLGLGLAIVKHLTELHGGTVALSSPGPNQGTTVVVTLPVTVVHAESTADDRTHPKSPGALSIDWDQTSLEGIKVLVVDDEPDARELVQRVLMECKANVTTAPSAADGLRILKEFHPDVIVSDIGMPEMDGFEFLRRIRSLADAGSARTPAIALTAYARSEDRTRAMLAGYLAHVVKPVESSELVATVATVVGRTGKTG